MCGSSYTPPYISKPTEYWFDFLKSINGVNTAVFIELMQGCDVKECKFACDAIKTPPKINIIPEHYEVVKELFHISNIKVILFGSGDVTTYPFKKVKRLWPAEQVNLAGSKVTESILKGLLDQGVDNILVNIYTVDEAVKINRFYSKLQKSYGFYRNKREADETERINIQVQVLKTHNYIDIINRSQIPILFRGVCESDPRHITANSFIREYSKQYGITLKSETISCKHKSMKPIIFKIDIINNKVKIYFRRCSIKNSAKHIMTLKHPINFGKNSNPLEIQAVQKFRKFIEAYPDCKKYCKGRDTWKAYAEL